MSDAPSAGRPGNGVYAALLAFHAGIAGVLYWITSAPPTPVEKGALLPPIVALVALTGIVFVLMATVRNVLVFLGKTSITYFRDYVSDVPSEVVERPARTFNNLLEVPMLFYVLALLMMETGHVDQIQVTLAWFFVAMRVAHAIVYIAFNYVPARFAVYLAGVVGLVVMWTRFAEQALAS